MELDLMKLQTLFNEASKSATMSAADKFVVYEYVARQLEMTVVSVRRVGGMALENAVTRVQE